MKEASSKGMRIRLHIIQRRCVALAVTQDSRTFFQINESSLTDYAPPRFVAAHWHVPAAISNHSRV